MPRRIESLFINGPAGKLEALLEEPEDQAPSQAALICHPHPQHGGTMHNKVVHRIARGMRRAGAAVLRFNYRGVNMSEGKYDSGVGETEDARAALAFLRSRYTRLPFSLAGFSFGSRIILKIGCQTPESFEELAQNGVRREAIPDPDGGARRTLCASRQIAVGFPAASPESKQLGHCDVPRVFIHSTKDEFCPTSCLESYFAGLTGPKQLIWVEASDHFFAGALDIFEEEVYRVASAGP